jgi:polar amino acid transport system substrate-binding protein
MKLASILLAALVGAVVALGVTRVLPPPSAAPQPVKETAFERVMRTNTLRCGYYTFPPMAIRDPNTGALSGFAVDVMEHIAKKTGLRIEWAEEVAFGNWPQALQSGRFDAVCAPEWPDAAQNRVVLFTRPLMYATVDAYVRADETRFGSDWKELNKPEVRLAVQEGNVTNELAHEWFDKATFDVLPNNVDAGQIVQDVVNGKADVALWDQNGFVQFSQNNPGKIKKLALTQPLKMMPFEMAVEHQESALRDFLNGVIDDAISTGEIDRLIDKWEAVPGTFLRVARPYAEPSTEKKP